MQHRRFILFASLCLGSVVFGALLTWVIIPPIINYMVDQNVILYENSEQYERFVNVPQPLQFKVYLFNVTNVDRVQDGEVPRVSEVGPYVYDQFRVKSIHNISADKTTITFEQIQTFHFNAKESAPFKQDDKIYVLNVALNVAEDLVHQIMKQIIQEINNSLDRTPIVRTVKHLIEAMRGGRSILQAAEDEGTATLRLVNMQVKSVFNEPKSMFLNTTPKELLFDGIAICVNAHGMAQIMCNILKARKLRTIREMPDGSARFSFFSYKNGSSDGIFTIHSGYGDSVRLTQILKWQGNSQLTNWPDMPGTDCNRIAGTDAGSFQPHLSLEKRSLLIFSTDVCRTVEIFYNGPTVYKGIRGLRYVANDNFMNEIGPKYNTQCFCSTPIDKVPKRDDGCLFPGAMDMSACHD